jgi:hypothetical protein
MIGTLIRLLETLGVSQNPFKAKGVATGGVYALKMLGTPVTTPADTAVNPVWTVALPALGPNDRVEVSLHFSVTSNTNAKTCSVTLDGTQIISVAASTANASFVVNFALQNQAASNAQAVHNTGNTGPTAVAGVFAIDTSTSKTLIIRGQKAVGTDTMTLQAGHIKIIEGVA